MIWLPRLERCVATGDVAGALRLLGTIVPDYRPSALIATELQAARVVREQPARVARDQPDGRRTSSRA